MIISSPCIGDCKMNEQNYCRGCLRTRDEIGRWLSITEQQRLTIIAICETRKSKISTDNT